MYKALFISIILFYCTYGYSLTDTLQIGIHQYILQTMEDETENELGATESFILLKFVTPKGPGKYGLKHTIYKGWGDCNSESLEIGGIEITDSSIILYSFWCHMGDAPVSPWGARKQVYVPKENGLLEMVYSELFVEASENGWEGYEGSIYLYETPVTAEEKQLYRDYIHKVEKEYKADFVYGKRADDLLKEVKEFLAVSIQEQTSHWDPNVGFGMRK